MKLSDYLKWTELRQQELAVIAGCTQGVISHLVRGRRTPSPRLALKIEKATDGHVTRMELLYPNEKK